MVKFGVEGWDTEITLDSSGNGQDNLVDLFNGFEIMQIICIPSNKDLVYKIEVLNTDMNEFTLNRMAKGVFNELINFPAFGRNKIRIRDAVPAEGTVKVAVRYR